IRKRWSTEFTINTDNEKIADMALIALSQALMPQIEEYKKTRINRYWEVTDTMKKLTIKGS
ncbi:MAG: hypothetical protein U9O53_02700, partial [archaeon]|nr:hypothetical protein [archaeon]